MKKLEKQKEQPDEKKRADKIISALLLGIKVFEAIKWLVEKLATFS